jgi:hypothetical protein
MECNGRLTTVDFSETSTTRILRSRTEVFMRPPRFEVLLDRASNDVLERPSANISDTLVPGMDHEANRVGHGTWQEVDSK